MKMDTFGRRSFLRALAAIAIAGPAGCAKRPHVQPCMPAIRKERASAGPTHLVSEGRTALETLPYHDTMEVDVHCHVFNVLDLPVDGFIRALVHGLGAPAFLDGGVQSATSWFHRKLVEHAYARADGKTVTDEEVYRTVRDWVSSVAAWSIVTPRVDTVGSKLKSWNVALTMISERTEAIADVAVLITKSREEVALTIAEDYPEISLFTAALVDYSGWINRDRMKPVRCSEVSPHDQIAVYRDLMHSVNKGSLSTKRTTRFSLLSFVAFNPLAQVLHEELPENARPSQTPLDDVKRALGIEGGVSLGFVGVKLYPSSGFLPKHNVRLRDLGPNLGAKLDDALEDLFDLCEEHEIPIMAHANDSNAFGPDFSWRGSPWGWRRVLDDHPKLRLNLGHMGFLNGVHEGSMPLKALAWAKRAGEDLLTPDYPNTYADLSNPELGQAQDDFKNRDRFLGLVQNDLLPLRFDDSPSTVTARLMYGSDWWLNRIEKNAKEYYKGFQNSLAGRFNAPAESAKPGDQNEPLTAKQFQEITGVSYPDFRARVMGKNALRYLGFLDENDLANTENANRKRVLAYFKSLGTPPAWFPLAEDEAVEEYRATRSDSTSSTALDSLRSAVKVVVVSRAPLSTRVLNPLSAVKDAATAKGEAIEALNKLSDTPEKQLLLQRLRRQGWTEVGSSSAEATDGARGVR